MTDFTDPEARAALLERVGADEYNRQMKEWQDSQVVATINGHRIRKITPGGWGTLFLVEDMGMAFTTQPIAEYEAGRLEPKI